MQKRGKVTLKQFIDNYFKKYPWKKTLIIIEKHCSKLYRKSLKNDNIKCLITENQLKKLWFKCKANKMERPIIVRKNNKADYIFKNCKYVEKPGEKKC